ncbi:DUF4082 domain-containing protein [Microbacterium sp.]|uniref:DUF4082 domain-containing protein n=1 Tax=Microbacterium sp. TaxID=51671 RepID=UPI002CB09A59|nr:DUF4082 domain-containing protein [Microbacterium sp.]HWK76502.1 DUF4082 domain-containing protein [Microbacterium sp.]
MFRIPLPESSRVRSRRARLALALAAVGVVAAGALVPAFTANSANAATTGIFADTLEPEVAADPDRVPVELGIRFSPTVSGTVSALQYYQGPKAEDVTTTTLWSDSGEVLAQETFKASSKVGWRTIPLDEPIALEADETYTASYQAPNGGYAVTERDLTTHDVQNGFTLTPGAGVYRYGDTGRMPRSTYQGSNYLVDIVYAPSDATGQPTTPKPTPTQTTSPKPEPEPTQTATPTPQPTQTATPTPAPTPTEPTTPPVTQPPVTQPTTPPTAAGCVGAPNTPGGADPWGGCWPGPQNTGYPKGLAGDTRKPVSLTAYTGPTTIRSCGVVIDSKVVNSTLIIEAGNGTTSKSTPCVTIRNSLVKGVIYSEKASYGPVLIEDTEVSPPDLPWWENIGRSNFFAYRVNSHGGEGVIKCDSNCEAKDNWVHGMELGGSYHYNAFGGNGTNNFRIEHNYASCGDWSKISTRTSDAGCSAVIGFYGDYAPIQNITINRNFLASTFTTGAGVHTQAGYCLNPGYYPGKPYPDTKNITVTDNVFARGSSGTCGVYGPTNSLNGRGAPNGNVWSGNRYADGTAIGRVEE